MKRSHVPNNEDYITNLHPYVASHILSRLTTKDAVRTSILSRDWKYKWTYSYIVDLDDQRGDINEETLAFLINNILSASRLLKSFRLSFDRRTDWMQTWVRGVLSHNVEIFVLNYYFDGIFFPSSLLNSASLRKLEVRTGGCTLRVVEDNFAPNLTSLFLERLDIVIENPSSRNLKFSFPVLETFTVTQCDWIYVRSLEIHAPSLTTFISEPEGYLGHLDYPITLVAPRLNKFHIDGSEKIILDGSSIISASLWGSTYYPEQIRNMLNEATNLEELKLSRLSFQLGHPFGPHVKLKRLTLIGLSNAEQLFHLLHSTPSLEILKMGTGYMKCYDYTTMESVPSCIASHLKEVHFEEFNCTKHQNNLIKFLLKYGKQLKKLSIVRCLENNNRRMVARAKAIFSASPKGSPCLTIDVE